MLILNLTVVPLNSVPKIPFLGKHTPETLKCFVLNETRYVIVFKGAHSEFDNCFLKFRSQNTYFGKICPKTSKCFVSNETQYTRVFKGADSEFGKFFLKSCLRPVSIYLLKVNNRNTRTSCEIKTPERRKCRLGETSFMGQFGLETQKHFVLNQTWFLEVFHI